MVYHLLFNIPNYYADFVKIELIVHTFFHKKLQTNVHSYISLEISAPFIIFYEFRTAVIPNKNSKIFPNLYTSMCRITLLLLLSLHLFQNISE